MHCRPCGLILRTTARRLSNPTGNYCQDFFAQVKKKDKNERGIRTALNQMKFQFFTMAGIKKGQRFPLPFIFLVELDGIEPTTS